MNKYDWDQESSSLKALLPVSFFISPPPLFLLIILLNLHRSQNSLTHNMSKSNDGLTTHNNGSIATLNDENQETSKQEFKNTSSKPSNCEKQIHSRFTSTITLAEGEEGENKVDKQHPDGKGQDEARSTVNNGQEKGDVEIAGTLNNGEKEEENTNQEPSHGRLLPLPRFLMVYACLSLAVLLTSLDQTVGEQGPVGRFSYFAIILPLIILLSPFLLRSSGLYPA